ncbi:hypothetical protein MP228_006485 [Amoeboaphelidium protococcarum]|nr:hypothetical protein MP228_006485 [Amoeboaphelidium protococcarum]
MPVCNTCGKTIAGGESYAQLDDGVNVHARCFNCNHCKLPLPAEYTMHDLKLYHLQCVDKAIASNQTSSGDGCIKCKKPLLPGGKAVRINGQLMHADCLKCGKCNKTIAGGQYFEDQGVWYDEACYMDVFSPKCRTCKRAILTNDKYTTYQSEKYHIDCFPKCSVCKSGLLSDSSGGDRGVRFKEIDGVFTCGKCIEKRYDPVNRESELARREAKAGIGNSDVFDKFGVTYGTPVAASKSQNVQGVTNKNLQTKTDVPNASSKTKDLLSKLNSQIPASVASNSSVPLQVPSSQASIKPTEQLKPADSYNNSKPMGQSQPSKPMNTFIPSQQSKQNSVGKMDSNQNVTGPGVSNTGKAVIGEQFKSTEQTKVSIGESKSVPKQSNTVNSSVQETSGQSKVVPPAPKAPEQVISSQEQTPLRKSSSSSALPTNLLDQIRKSSIEKLNKVDDVRDASTPSFLREESSSNQSSGLKASLSKSLSRMNLASSVDDLQSELQRSLSSKRLAMRETSPERVSADKDDW